MREQKKQLVGDFFVAGQKLVNQQCVVRLSMKRRKESIADLTDGKVNEEEYKSSYKWDS